MNIVAHRKIFYCISGFLFLASILSIAIFGLKLGIDFTGGSIIGIEYPNGARPSAEEIHERLLSLALGEVRIQPSANNAFLIRLKHIDEPTHQAILSSLGPDAHEREFNTIGPTIGSELKNKSAIAIVLVILLIVIYIAWAFRKVSEPVLFKGAPQALASWKYGATTVAALFHDVFIPAGFFALAGYFFGFEVDTLFVTAVLTILGFSVHDTIVVFDRIRENLKKSVRADFRSVVDISVRQTVVRSINTSLAVVLALLAVFIFGGETTRVFSLTLIIGIIVGTYSSICIASPLLVTWYQFQLRRSA